MLQNFARKLNCKSATYIFLSQKVHGLVAYFPLLNSMGKKKSAVKCKCCGFCCGLPVCWLHQWSVVSTRDHCSSHMGPHIITGAGLPKFNISIVQACEMVSYNYFLTPNGSVLSWGHCVDQNDHAYQYQQTSIVAVRMWTLMKMVI